MDTSKGQAIAGYVALVITLVWIAYLALGAAEYEQQRVLDLGPDCTIYEDGSAVCQDDTGGWYFEEGTF